MKTTPFTDVHIALGPRCMVAVLNMPISIPELSTNTLPFAGVGVFDVSMGEFWVERTESSRIYSELSHPMMLPFALGQSTVYLFPKMKQVV